VVARQTLITFVGLRDPYAHDPHEDGRHKGPILTLLDERSFDRVLHDYQQSTGADERGISGGLARYHACGPETKPRSASSNLGSTSDSRTSRTRLRLERFQAQGESNSTYINPSSYPRQQSIGRVLNQLQLDRGTT
jgi:hypothetical protein